jgi:hypothetical protein
MDDERSRGLEGEFWLQSIWRTQRWDQAAILAALICFIGLGRCINHDARLGMTMQSFSSMIAMLSIGRGKAAIK